MTSPGEPVSRELFWTGFATVNEYEGRDPIHPVQVKLGARLTRQLWPKVRTVDTDVSLLRAASCGVSPALPQAIKRGNDVPHDQVEVRTTVAESNAHGTDQ